MAKHYIFCGEGAGVPGLPHEINDQEADERGLRDLLQAAIEAGNYTEADSKASRKSSKDGE
jgi:hypothetical protein